jgi:hypothetical protein
MLCAGYEVGVNMTCIAVDKLHRYIYYSEKGEYHKKWGSIPVGHNEE